MDLVLGEWTRLRIEISGVKMRLYVNGAAEPALLVNDPVGWGRDEAYFANPRLIPKGS